MAYIPWNSSCNKNTLHSSNIKQGIRERVWCQSCGLKSTIIHVPAGVLFEAPALVVQAGDDYSRVAGHMPIQNQTL